MENRKNILLGCTGSVASMKMPELVRELISVGFNVKVIVTEHAKHFYNVEDISEVEIYTDEDEWLAWSKRGDPVLHIDICKWADAFVVAPLDANTLAKMAMGLCDNLLTCAARAWDTTKPLFFCPAMNTKMYLHPVTSQHIVTLKAWGYIEVPAVTKTLICGDTGIGAMAHLETIVDAVKNHFGVV